MGYPIKILWDNDFADEVRALNEIIDNEHRADDKLMAEIHRKLDLKREFDREFQEQLQWFNFDVVLRFMNSVNWTWSGYENGEEYRRIPDRATMTEQIERLYKDGLYSILEEGSEHVYTQTGGLVLLMNIYNGHAYVGIHFDIAAYVS